MVIGYFSGVVIGYSLNNKWTFNYHAVSYESIIRYFALYAISLCFGVFTIFTLVEFIYLNVYLANIITIGCTTIINFTGAKYGVFEK